MSSGSALRSILNRAEVLVLPGAFDALSARLIEQADFEAVYVTGAGFANAAFGFPDIALVTMSEVVDHVARIADAVNIPVIVDADTGFGDLLQVRRTVHELERAGAAAIQLEDQIAPKRCGHFDGQQVIPTLEMMRKIAIARDSRRSDDLVLIARTDVRSVEGFDAAVKRTEAYAAAGADIVFVEALRTEDELRALPERVSVPLLANMVEGGKTPVLTAEELQNAGYAIALFANAALRASMLAVARVMGVLRADGGTDAALPLLASWQERQRVMGLAAYQALEERYIQEVHN
jgi:2-methylisocitrate lyase-like PEP mutase family enzyme